MATKAQLERWATAQQINTTGMSAREIEAALDCAALPQSVFPAECTTKTAKLRWAVQQNLNQLGRGLGLIRP